MIQNDEQIYETVVMDVDAIGEGCWNGCVLGDAVRGSSRLACLYIIY